MNADSRVACLLMSALIAGCSDAPPLVQVDGLVTRGGKPVPGVLVQFYPEDGRPSWGLSDEKGKFQLHYSKHYEGARLGKHRVFVGFDRSAAPFDESGKQKLSADQRAILDKYGSQDKSPLEADLHEDGQAIEIKLD